MNRRKIFFILFIVILLLLLLLNYFLPLRAVYQELKIMSYDPNHLKAYSFYGSKPSNLKIALCISGQFRYLNKILENHYTIMGLQPDVFIYAEGDLDTKSRNQVTQYYKPKQCVWDSHVVQPVNRLSVNNVKMFKRIYQCDLLRQQYEKDNLFKYDVVIRMRPDTVFYEAFPVHLLRKPLLEQRIYFPMRTKNEPLLYGLPDMVFWGNGDAMKKMVECYLHLEKFNGIDVCPNEYIFMNYMESVNLIGRKVVFKLNNFDRTFRLGIQFIDKYIKGKASYVKNGYECYCNNKYKNITIEEEN